MKRLLLPTIITALTFGACDSQDLNDESGMQDTPAGGKADEIEGEEGDFLEDFLVVYLAGESHTNLTGIGSRVELRSRPYQVYPRGNGGFVVFGEEENGVGLGLRWKNAVWQFSATGELEWKRLDVSDVAGVGPEDATYTVERGGTQIRKIASDGTLEWETSQSLWRSIRERLNAQQGFGWYDVGASVTDEGVVIVAFNGVGAEGSNRTTFVASDGPDSELFFSSTDAKMNCQQFTTDAAGNPAALCSSREYLDPELCIPEEDFCQQTHNLTTVVTLDPVSGAPQRAPVDMDDFLSGPIGDSSPLAPDLYPVDVADAPDGDDFIAIVREGYADSIEATSYHLVRVSREGIVTSHTDIDNAASPNAVSLTADGVIVVGRFTEPRFDHRPFARLYDHDLGDLGDYHLDELDEMNFQWSAATAVGDRTLLVGEIDRVTMLLHGAKI